MKFILAILLTALLAFVAAIYLPWWSIAICAFLVAMLIRLRPSGSFLSGFIGGFLLWGGLSGWINMKNEGALSSKIGELLGVGPYPIVVILVSALVAGLVAGMAALTASYLQPSNR